MTTRPESEKPRPVINQNKAFLVALILTGLMVFALPFSNSVFLPGAIMAIAGIVVFIRHRQALWSERWIRWLLILMMALWLPQIVALLVAVNFERALRTALTYPLYTLAMLPMLWVARERDIATPLLYLTTGLAVFWSLDGLLQFTIGANIFGHPYNGSRISGLFYPDLSLGIVLAGTVPLVLEASRRLTRRHRLYALAPIIVFVTIVLAGSRAAIISSLIAIAGYGLFLIWFYRPQAKTVATLSLILTLTSITALWMSPETRNRLLVVSEIFDMNLDSFNAATSKRGTIWLAASAVALDEPLLGVGVRGVERTAHERGYTDMEFSHVHFFGLDVLVSTGFIGLLSYLSALVGILLALWQKAKANRSLSPFCVTAGLTIITIFNPINAHWTIYSSYASTMGYLFIGIAIALLVQTNSSQSYASRVSSARAQ